MMMWGNFIAVLNAQAKTEQEEEEAIAAANRLCFRKRKCRYGLEQHD
jgi:heme oxygenase